MQIPLCNYGFLLLQSKILNLQLLLLHRINHGVKLAGVRDFDLGLAALLAADHPDRRRVLDVQTHPHIFVRPY